MPDLITEEYATAALAAGGVTLDDAQQAHLADAIASASSAIRRWCGRDFTAADLDERLDGDGSATLLLKQFPVNSIDSIEVGRTDPETIDPDDYDFDPGTGEVRLVAGDGDWAWGYRARGFPPGWRNVRVRYNAGWADVPADVRDACVELVKAKIQRYGADGTLSSETVGDYSYNQARPDELAAMPRPVLEALALYRIHRA